MGVKKVLPYWMDGKHRTDKVSVHRASVGRPEEVHPALRIRITQTCQWQPKPLSDGDVRSQELGFVCPSAGLALMDMAAAQTGWLYQAGMDHFVESPLVRRPGLVFDGEGLDLLGSQPPGQGLEVPDWVPR